jgi:hypothetical protein
MVDLDGLPAGDAGAGLAVRAQPGQAQLAGEAHVALRVAEDHDLVEQGTGPNVGVVGEAGGQVGGVGLERVRDRGPAHAGLPLPVEVGPDRLAIP